MQKFNDIFYLHYLDYLVAYKLLVVKLCAFAYIASL